MKIVTVVGARPQFIKAATVSRVVRDKISIEEIIVHTGQHYDSNMSKIFFDELDIPKPHYNLGVGSESHGKQTGEMLRKIEEVLVEEKPNYLLVYGDTNSTLAGALAAAKLHIPIVHVEAGLRSFNRKMPEEINRIVTDHLSDFLFVPTECAMSNLQAEGLIKNSFYVGDVMYDSVLFYLGKINNELILEKIKVEKDNYILCTMHRAENTDSFERLSSIASALNKINSKIPVVMPLHPRTKFKLKLFNIKLNVKFIEPVGYLDMLNLTKNAKAVITDSGGLQKEAFFCGKFCITLRDETEWTELVDNGWNILVGSLEDEILFALNNIQKNLFLSDLKPYGEGNAAHKIIDRLCK